MRSDLWIYFIFSLIGFCLGSIMFAWRIPMWLKGIDIREVSDDHNPGVANAYTCAGFQCGTLSLLCELGKGFLPVNLCLYFAEPESLLFIPVMVAPVLGHAFPFLQKEKGGKAIAVSFGVLLGLKPCPEPVIYLIFFFLFFSLILVISPHAMRTIITFLCFAISVFIRVRFLSIRIGCCLISCIVTYKHLENRQNVPLQISLFHHR